uniref:Ribosomal RNA-processing protein 14 N-terminal domain-containing protein n=1 Tax=Salix viminalis TaxID=40686 RepID=A0A6N2MNH3_SALVM
MGKKRQILVSESDPDIDLKFPIHQHSLICDKLIKLVPAKFYLPTDEKEKPWFHGLSKGGAKASAKKRQGKSLRKQGENAIIPRSLLQQPLVG